MYYFTNKENEAIKSLIEVLKVTVQLNKAQVHLSLHVTFFALHYGQTLSGNLNLRLSPKFYYYHLSYPSFIRGLLD